MSDKFGLENARSALKPREAPARADDSRDTDVDAAADRRGFVSREPAQAKIVRRRVSNETMENFSTRVPTSVYNRFVLFMEHERERSMWAALERLLDVAGVDERGRVRPRAGDSSASGRSEP